MLIVGVLIESGVVVKVGLGRREALFCGLALAVAVMVKAVGGRRAKADVLQR